MGGGGRVTPLKKKRRFWSGGEELLHLGACIGGKLPEEKKKFQSLRDSCTGTDEEKKRTYKKGRKPTWEKRKQLSSVSERTPGDAFPQIRKKIGRKK